jgi:hypothetical protein
MDKIWDDVIYACSNQRIFCSEGCVQAWLAATGRAQGYIMDLATPQLSHPGLPGARARRRGLSDAALGAPAVL